MNIQKTQYFRPAAVHPASLLIVDKEQTPRQFLLKGNLTFGKKYPESDCDITVESRIVSRRHGEFVYDGQDDSYYYIDYNSANGTYVNGVRLETFNERGSKFYKLSDGDILRVDRSALNDPHPESVLMIFSRSFDVNEKWNVYNIESRQPITIGRGENNAIKLGDMMASREHAEIRQTNRGVLLFDKKSQNGVSVNGWPIKGKRNIFDHDVIKIANTVLIMAGSRIIYNDANGQSGCLLVSIDRKTVNFGKKTLLSDLRFEVDKGDFVLILGGSGAGKTTRVKAI